MKFRNGIKAIIWDLDGTLIHFKINSMQARRITIGILISHGIKKKCLSIKKSILENINISREIFKSIGYDSRQMDDIIKEIDEEISKIEYKAALDATMIEGIEQVHIFARENNLKQGIYTFNKYKYAKISLEKVRLLDYFSVIIGRDNISNPKPHPDHLLEICKRLHVEPTEIVVVGDNFRDIEGALNVGAHSIALHTSLAKVETLQKADVIIQEKEIPLKLKKEIEKLL